MQNALPGQFKGMGNCAAQLIKNEGELECCFMACFFNAVFVRF